MSDVWIDASEEYGSLRRAANLLERARQDGWSDPELDALSAGVSAIRRLTADGRLIPRVTIEQLAGKLARVTPLPDATQEGDVSLLVQSNALVETQELLQRLARSDGRAAHGSRHSGAAHPGMWQWMRRMFHAGHS